MAEGTSGATGATAGATSQGQAGPVSTTPQAAEGTAPKSETTQKEATTAKESTKSVEKSIDINTPEPAKKDKAEKPEKPTEETVKKHRYADKLAKEFPDRKFEKPEDYDSALDEHLTNLEGFKEKGVGLNKKLIALFDAEPHVGDIVRDMVNGATFRQALARHISPDELTPDDGDPDHEGWSKNKTAREEAAAKRKERETQREADFGASAEAMKAFAEENKMDEESAEAFYNKIDEMIGAINSGKITKEALLAMKRAFNYENDIAKAREEGLVAGKNENITARKETPEKQGDGIPRPSKSTPTDTKKAEPTYIDGLLNKINSRKVI